MWLTKQILREQRERSGSSTAHVKYGDPEFIPSFWLNDQWDWSLCTKNLSNITNQMYTGPSEYQDFLTRLIENCLAMTGKDAENYYITNLNQTILRKRKKAKGIHASSHILEDAFSEGRDSNIDDTENEVNAPEAEYIRPSNIPNSTFIPRRTLPDDETPNSSVPSCPAPPATEPQQTSPSNDSQPSYILSPNEFEYSWSSRRILKPAHYLTQLEEPLHPGWKILENRGQGACLFMSAADHIYLKDFTLLRKYVHCASTYYRQLALL